MTKPDVIKAALTVGKCDCEIGMCTHRVNCRNNPLVLNNYGHTIIIKELDDKRVDLCIAGQHTYLERNQAHLLMLWLQEHLK